MELSGEESGVEEQQLEERPKEQSGQESGEGLKREDSFVNNFFKKCEVRGELDVEDKGVSGDQELSSELVDEDGDDEVFLKEEEKGDRQQEVLGPDRDQLEEEKGDKLCSLLEKDGDQDLLLEEEKGDNQLEEEEGDLLLLEVEGDELLQEDGDVLLEDTQDLL